MSKRKRTEVEQIYMPLLIKIKEIKNIKDYNVKINDNGWEYSYSRYISYCSDKNRENIIFIKMPKIRAYHRNKHYAKLEELAFIISSKLKLNVVPITIAPEYHEDIIEEYIAQNKRSFQLSNTYEGTVVQDGVNKNTKQIHINNERKITKEDLTSYLDIDQVHKAIIFNIITGRHDGTKVNTVIDVSKGIMEVDNEAIGQRTTNSWLPGYYMETEIKKEIVEEFLSHGESIIEEILANTKHMNIDERTEKNIKENFMRLRELFGGKKPIKINDLKDFYYEPEQSCL